jgi:hypothetical protein
VRRNPGKLNSLADPATPEPLTLPVIDQVLETSLLTPQSKSHFLPKPPLPTASFQGPFGRRPRILFQAKLMLIGSQKDRPESRDGGRGTQRGFLRAVAPTGRDWSGTVRC